MAEDSPVTEGRSISKEELNALPIRAYEGPTHLIHSPDQLPACIEALSKESLLGFDTETRPAFQRGVSYPPALIQLATADRVFVIQILLLKEIQPLLDILEDEKILKAGVAITDDLKQLREVYEFKPGGFIEIGTLAKGLEIKQTGLRSLAGMFLGFRISKKEQRSNWAKPDLTPSQVTYAATDAWVSREIYQNLVGQWGDRPLPAPVDLPEPGQSPPKEPSDKRSRSRRRRRNYGRGDRGRGHTPRGNQIPSAAEKTGPKADAKARDIRPEPQQQDLFPPDV